MRCVNANCNSCSRQASHASHGYVDADVTLKLWKAHFDYFYREEDWFVFPLTLHPDTAGRPHVLMTVERLIEYIQTFEGVEFCTMEVGLHASVLYMRTC